MTNLPLCRKHQSQVRSKISRVKVVGCLKNWAEAGWHTKLLLSKIRDQEMPLAERKWALEPRRIKKSPHSFKW